MVLPEGAPPPERPRSGSRSLLFVIAAAALALGAIVLGALTAPPPEAAPESTTTTSEAEIEQPIDFDNFTIDQIARGDPLDWSQSHSVEDAYPIALFEHGGWIYAFATQFPNFSGHDEGGLQAWRSEDGTEWESLGHVIDQSHTIGAVTATNDALIAVEPGIRGANLTLWRSNDGVAWSPEVIEIEGLTENMAVYPQAVGGNDRLLVLATQTSIDVMGLIQETLTDLFGYDLTPANFGWTTNSNGDRFDLVLWGPFGVPIAEISADDLGLTESEMELLESEYQGFAAGVDVWVSDDGQDWVEGEIEDAMWISAITATDAGQMIATGWDNQDSRAWTSHDGFNWAQQVTGLVPEQLEVWEGKLVGPSRQGRPSVVVSQDGSAWESIGPEDHFPLRISWHMFAFAAGPGGIGATIEGWISNPGQIRVEEPVTLVDGDAVLTIDYFTSTYSLETSGATYTWSMNSSRTPDGIAIDPANESVAFHDPDTDEHLATFSFDDLAEAEQSYWTDSSFEDEHQAFVFYGDDEEWIIQDAAIGGDMSIRILEVTDKHVFAAATSSDGRFSPGSSPGFEIWSAPIP